MMFLNVIIEFTFFEFSEWHKKWFNIDQSLFLIIRLGVYVIRVISSKTSPASNYSHRLSIASLPSPSLSQATAIISRGLPRNPHLNLITLPRANQTISWKLTRWGSTNLRGRGHILEESNLPRNREKIVVDSVVKANFPCKLLPSSKNQELVNTSTFVLRKNPPIVEYWKKRCWSDAS